MSSNNHDRDRASQQDAHAWSTFTGKKYTAAQRQIVSRLAVGFLGDRISARELITVLDEHPLIGARGGNPILGDDGYGADEPWHFDGKTDYPELALVTDMLRMFTPTAGASEAEVSSYSLKHTAEKLLAPHCSYVSNGRLIWAAAALGLDLVEQAAGSPNLLVGISEREHDYVWRMVDAGGVAPRADHHRPPGLRHLQEALARLAAGEPPAPRWVRPVPQSVVAPFHDWLSAQTERSDPVGEFARDYTAGVSNSDHQVARIADEMLTILRDVHASPAAYSASVTAISEWFAVSPTTKPIRTQLISEDSHDVGGFGAGPGDVESYVYACPCGMGEIVEEHDNIPGFRDHSVHLLCENCRSDWRFADGRPTRSWGLVPTTAG